MMRERKEILWWPDAEKGLEALPGTRSVRMLEPGLLLSRYSRLRPECDYGWWFEPDGIPKDCRLTNPFDEQLELRTFKLLRPVTVELSKAVPWFDLQGTGLQVQVMDSYENEVGGLCRLCVRDMIRFGIIEESGRPVTVEPGDRFSHALPPAVIMPSRDSLLDCPDGVYATKDWQAIFHKCDGVISPVSSFDPAFMVLQMRLFSYANHEPGQSAPEREISPLLDVLTRDFRTQDDFDRAFADAHILAHGDVPPPHAEPSDLTQWCDGTYSNADQIKTVNAVSEDEWQILYWERGTRVEIIRIFGWKHLCEYILNDYFKIVL